LAGIVATLELNGSLAGHREEYYEVADQRFLGDEEFSAELTRNYEDKEPRKWSPRKWRRR
jgi:hypothetical protein